MNFSKLLTGGLIILGLLGMAAKCPADDPGKPGGTSHRTVRIGDGTRLSSSNFGLWKASGSSACHWTVTVKGKVAASGGLRDKVISGHGLSGGILHASNCGWFYK